MKQSDIKSVASAYKKQREMKYIGDAWDDITLMDIEQLAARAKKDIAVINPGSDKPVQFWYVGDIP